MGPLLLKTFVVERLNAAAEEICQVFERTIAKYEEEASISKQEIERLRGLLLERRADTSQFYVCDDEKACEQPHFKKELSISIQREDSEPRRIKEEDNEFWATGQEEEENADGADAVSLPPRSFVCKDNKQENTNPLLQPQTPTSTTPDEFQETQEAKTLQLPPPPALALSSQSAVVKDAEEPAESFVSDQTQTQQSHTSLIHMESTELADVNSSSRHLPNHPFCFHSKDAESMCAVCGGTFEPADSLDQHLKAHESSNCCHVCGKHCNSKTALTEHVASHAGVKLHRCHVCGKGCSRKGDLKIHLRIHTGEKPFCCSFCCKSFTHSGHLRKHMRSHTGERPHRCEVCGRRFLQSTHLKYHLRTHTQKR